MVLVLYPFFKDLISYLTGNITKYYRCIISLLNKPLILPNNILKTKVIKFVMKIVFYSLYSNNNIKPYNIYDIRQKGVSYIDLCNTNEKIIQIFHLDQRIKIEI